MSILERGERKMKRKTQAILSMLLLIMLIGCSDGAVGITQSSQMTSQATTQAVSTTTEAMTTAATTVAATTTAATQQATTTTAAPKTTTVATTTTAKPAAAPAAQPSGGGAYVGNANTKKFHLSSCYTIGQMNESNKVSLSSREAAISAGYEPCKKCYP